MKKIYNFNAVSLKKPSLFFNKLIKEERPFKKLLVILLGCTLLTSFYNKVYADVTLTTSTVAAGSINQGSNNNIVYVSQMSVTVSPVTVSSIQFTLNGTINASDLSLVSIYFNATTPTISGSSLLNNAAANFAAGHTYTISLGNAIAAGASGYYIVAVNVNPAATDNHTIKIDGATNPIVFGYTTSPTVVNNQSDIAGVQTIQASDVTETTSTIAAANIDQGSNNNIVYTTQLSAATEPVTVSSIQFTLNGTINASDLSLVSIYFNATTPTISGSSLLNNAAANFAAGHTYTISLGNAIAAGASGYYIVAVNVNPAATDNHTIKIDGATNPVTFGYTTSPNIINSQTDIAGVQTIQAADITETTSTIAAANIDQGSNNNIVYTTQLSAATEPVTVSSIQFTLNGTINASDLSLVSIYFNATTPTISGSSLLNNAAANFAAGHTYTISLGNAIAAGTSGYYIIAVNVNPAATDNHTIKIDGATNPVTFGYTTSPNIINSQTDIAGVQTIQASDVTETTSTIAAANIDQGSNNNIVYTTQLSAATEPVTVSSIQFTLNGTINASDLSLVSIYFNATTPTISGSSLLNNAAANFAAGHTYTISLGNAIAAGASGYYIIAVNVNPAATDNHTIKIDGATNPVTFGYTTSPNIINSQTDIAGVQTIQASDVTETTSTIAAANIDQGSNNNIVYTTQLSAATEPVTVSSIQFTLNGTINASDLSLVSIYFNATTPTISGSSLLNNAVANFASGHTYTISLGNAIAAGASGYYIIAVNVNPAATDNHTIKIDGTTNPVIFGYTTSPNITNSQTDVAGVQTIQAADITETTSTVATNMFSPGSNNNIVYTTQLSVATESVSVSSIQFTMNGTHNASDLTQLSIYFNATTPTISGSSLLNNAAANFAAGHAYNVSLGNTIAAGASGYYIIAVNVDPAATVGHTVFIDGAASPVSFGFTTVPNVTNNQADSGGLHTLPLNFVTITGYQKNAGIEIEWKVASQLNIDKYIVQRSNDGRSFNSIGQLNPQNGSAAGIITYNLLDATPLPGINFYRIRAVNKDGGTAYSAVVRVTTNKGKEAISIYPNPVIKNGQLILELSQLQEGNYTLVIINQQGQQVLKQNINYAGGNRVQTIGLQNLAAGIYSAEVRTPNSRFVKSFIIE